MLLTAHKTSWVRVFCLFIVFGLLFLYPSVFLVDGQPPNASVELGLPVPPVKFPDTEIKNNTVYVGIWLINIYNYQYKTGNYIFDMYLYFFWSDPNIATIDWYLMNGYPVNPATTILVSSNLTGIVKDEIYRVTAFLTTAPDARDFPFDSIKLRVTVELITQGYSTEIKWLDSETGVNPAFNNPGWKTTNVELTVSNHAYPLGVELPQAEMTITQQKQRPEVSAQSFIAPIIFGVVSAVSFLFTLKDAASVGLRLGLNTSMLVTTLLFNFTASSNIPPSSTISLYGLLILSILLFVAMNLLVTISGFVLSFYYKNEKYAKRINRWGFVLSIIVPLLFFLVMELVRS